MKIRRQRPDFLHLAGRPNQQILILTVQSPQRSHYIADVSAHPEFRHPPNVDGNLHEGNLTTEPTQKHKMNNDEEMEAGASQTQKSLASRAVVGPHACPRYQRPQRSFNYSPSGGFEDAMRHREHGSKWKEPNTSANGIPFAQLYALTSACTFALRSA
jgi:hypothetical protein